MYLNYCIELKISDFLFHGDLSRVFRKINDPYKLMKQIKKDKGRWQKKHDTVRKWRFANELRGFRATANCAPP